MTQDVDDACMEWEVVDVLTCHGGKQNVNGGGKAGGRKVQ